MKSKVLFWLLALIVFGTLGFCGYQFFETNALFFYIIEGITLIAAILFIFLYMRLIRPYKIIADGMELLKEQDFSTRLRPVSDSEANKLISVFNKMIDSLKEERLQVREKNHFLDLLIQASPQGVIILDFDEYVTDINSAGLKFLNISDKNAITGKQLKDLKTNIGKSLSELQAGEDSVIRDSGITAYRCVRSSFIDKGFNHPFILIEELTDELLKIEKKSYEGVIRMMAHEVNNSIGAISSTLNVMADILMEDKENDFSYVLPAVEASSERCRHLGRFVSNFAEVVKIPDPNKTEVDLNELAKSVEALSKMECNRRNIELTLNLSDKKCFVCIDAIQFEQVLVNIIKNAYEAIEENGEIQIITNNNPMSIAIIDNGSGISGEAAQNLFVPFFSTKPAGQGVGLMIVKEILRNHNLTFTFQTEDKLTSFKINF